MAENIKDREKEGSDFESLFEPQLDVRLVLQDGGDGRLDLGWQAPLPVEGALVLVGPAEVDAGYLTRNVVDQLHARRASLKHRQSSTRRSHV